MNNSSCQTCATQTQGDVFETLVYFLHKMPVLSKLFFSWISMGNDVKSAFNFQIMQNFSWEKHNLCVSVFKAFNFWNKIQDTEGAPGFRENPLKYELGQEVALDLKNIIKAMEDIIQQIMLKREVGAELLKNAGFKKDLKDLKLLPDGSGDLFSL